MKSRVHPTYKTQYHVQNWAASDRALVCRGDITIGLSPAAIAAWDPDGAGTRGAPRKYSDLARNWWLTSLFFRARSLASSGNSVRNALDETKGWNLPWVDAAMSAPQADWFLPVCLPTPLGDVNNKVWTVAPFAYRLNDEVPAGARAGAPKREGEMLTASPSQRT